MKKLDLTRYDYASALAFMSYAACSMAVPMVLIPLAMEMGFPLQDDGKGAGGALQLGRSIPMVASMLLCGFLAGRLGKSRSIGFSLLLMGLGILICAGAPNYWVVFFALLVAGLGEGVIEGIATPFIQDQHPEESGRYVIFSHSFWSVGVLVSVLVTGALLTWGVHWRWILLGISGFAVIPMLLFLLPDRRGRLKSASDKPVSSKKVFLYTLQILRIPRFWVFFFAMFFAGGGEFCLTFWTASYIKLEYPDASMFLAGVGTACFAGGMIVGRMVPGFFIRQDQLRRLVLMTGFAATGFALLLPLLNSVGWFCVLLFAIGVMTGPFWPSVQSYSADCMKVDTTMLFVLLSCAGVPGCGFFTMLMGVIGDAFGFRMSLLLVPFCFLSMTLLVCGTNTLRARRESAAANP